MRCLLCVHTPFSWLMHCLFHPSLILDVQVRKVPRAEATRGASVNSGPYTQT